ncbi:uncharacterized protein MYCFIDRAFT_191119 [Pseudocercospora fijiensis CIRAD86]|uniref:TauD/TfdA-like domain-containing protein n=1 Tax=Pseudocercospora fijiensis (strain CIRAD86) TaxID=383855 RepID=M2YIV5_PSEFD|nr:uncharacterized protein MYCFIDRAFT_191119 [Pseudocercospora fijiensis CIRAD86]EME77685.1 hypothetical protein MYCFIDRAFT_191119 [Pseudocercospora fijiensis CIRAD86]
MPHSTESELEIKPIDPGQDSNVKFGAFISGVDLNNLDDATFQAIRQALYENSLVIIKNQQKLTPTNHFNFVRRFDPEAAAVHGHGSVDRMKEARKDGGKSLLALGSVHGIPEAPGVRMIGAGYQGDDHYGLKGVTMDPTSILKTQVDPPTPEEISAGVTRFGRWHIDCAMYDLEPPKVTALRCVKLPDQGLKQTVVWDDGSGAKLENVRPGRTAYFSCEQLYEMLTPEEKAISENSYVTYSPHPYQWISRCKQDPIGITIAQGQGLELKDEELPPVDEKKVKKYPMVWHNEVTGKKAFMVHSIIAKKLHLKSSPTDEEKVIDDVDEVRAWLYGFDRRMVKPRNVLIAPYEEGDVCVWHNRGMKHAFLEYPLEKLGARTMHQVNIAASCPPS